MVILPLLAVYPDGLAALFQFCVYYVLDVPFVVSDLAFICDLVKIDWWFYCAGSQVNFFQFLNRSVLGVSLYRLV